MLKRIHRLNHHEFKACFDTGVRSHTSPATIISAKSPLWGVAVVVPKKVKKTAVARNRIRRQVYAAIAVGSKITSGHHVVIIKPMAPNIKALPKEALDQIISRINQVTVQ
jgi:ribonuclease P protein component